MSFRPWLVVVLAIASPALLVRCSLVNDLGPLGEGGREAGGVPDAQPPPTSDGARDEAPAAAGDASHVIDSASPAPAVDARADAMDAGPPPNAPPVFLDAGTTTWCDGVEAGVFCADFDRAPLPAGFNSSDGQFLLLTSTHASSTPNDLLVAIPSEGAGIVSSKLSRGFSQRADNRAVLAFDFYPEVINETSSGMLIAALDFLGNGQAKYSVRIAYNQGANRVEESFLGSPPDIYHATFNLPEGVWSRVRVELSFGGDAGPSTLGVFVNGAQQGTLESLSPPAGLDGRPALLVGGVYGTGPETGWAFRYDNVTLDVQ